MNLPRTSWIAALLCVCQVGLASAQQLERVKSGANLAYDLIRYDTRGREVYVSSTTPITAEVLVSAEGRTLTYSTGRIEKFDVEHTLVERTVQGQTQRIGGKQLLKWMPDGRDYKSVRKVTESYEVRQCGMVDLEYESTPKEAIYKVAIAGKEADLKVIEFVLNGKWTGGSCGTGKQTRRIVYSPELDMVVETEFLTYLANGILNVGNGIRLKSVN
jgi:hypothetical protein